MKPTARTTSQGLEVFLSTGFLTALGVLLLNDFYLKAAFHNEVTGKLSDFAGLFALSLAIMVLVPHHWLLSNILLFFTFVIWKTPFADGLIAAWNSLEIFIIARTVDYTDYIAAVVLPLAALYFKRIPEIPPSRVCALRTAASYCVVVVAVFAFTATTLVSDRHLTLPNGYAVREKHSQIESALRTNPLVSGIKVSRDSSVDVPNTDQKVAVVWFDFLIAEQTCDSNPTAMQIMIREYDRVTNIDSISIRFTCHEYESNKNYNALEKQYVEHLRKLFERTVLKDFHVVGSK